MGWVLPGGLVDDQGVLHDDVDLRALSGREEELLVARSGRDTASLVTALLSRCVERIGTIAPVDDEVARRLLVPDRQFLLLRLREATFGERVSGSVPCPWPDCGTRVGVSFSTADVPVEPSTDKGPDYSCTLSPEAMPGAAAEADRTVRFRLPNGGDQEAIAPLLAENEAAALTGLLARCVTAIGHEQPPGEEAVSRLSPRARHEIEEAMQRVSPHVSLVMDATCVECGRQFSTPFDLQRFFFGELRLTRDLLYREVHYLAYHYHWSEHEIMDMARSQRRQYIDVLADEIERLNAGV